MSRLIVGVNKLALSVRAKKNPVAFAAGFSDRDSVNRYGVWCLATATITTGAGTTATATIEAENTGEAGNTDSVVVTALASDSSAANATNATATTLRGMRRFTVREIIELRYI